MPEDTLKVKATLDDRQLTSQLKKSASKVENFGNQVSSGMGLATAFATGAGAGAALAVLDIGLQALGATIGFVSDAGIGMNAMLEKTELQFTTLMGSSDRAREHVAMLFQLAKETPFETGPIIEASRLLQTFGGDALNTRDMIVTVGDAAAATNAPIEELGFWVGRAYSVIQSGKPFGEAAARLQEMAVLSPQARSEMEALQKTGASTDEVWQVLVRDFEKFDGAMIRQANTLDGLASSATDALNILGAEAFEPFFDLAKGGLREFNKLLNSPMATQFAQNIKTALQSVIKDTQLMVGRVMTSFSQMDSGTARSLGRIAGYMIGLGKQAVKWGTGIVNAIAEGMIAAVGAVIRAINYLGSIIRGQIEPHSPPKFLPDLDKMGKKTAEVYLEGWTEANFADIQDFGSQVQGILEGLQMDGGMKDTDVIPALLSIQNQFAEAMYQFEEFGTISEETFETINQSAGGAGEEIEALARTYFKLRNAQKNLNEVTQRYDAILAPLNDRLRELRGEQESLDRAGEIRALQSLLTQTGLSPERRRQIQAEIEALNIEEQIADAEAAREDALEVAENQVDVAQEEYDALQAQLDLQQQQSSLLQQQQDLLDGIEDATEGMAENFDDWETSLEGIADELESALDPLNEQLDIIRLQQEELDDTRRLAEIRNQLSRDDLSLEERKRLELEEQGILTRQQIRDIEAAELGIDLQPLRDIPIVLEDIETATGGIGEGIADSLTGALDGLPGAVDEAIGEMEDLFSPEALGLDDNFQEEMDRVIDEMEAGFEEGLPVFENQFAELGESMQPINQALSDMWVTLKPVADKWIEWASQVDGLNTPFWALALAVEGVETGLDAMRGAVEEANTKFQETFGFSVPDVVGTFTGYWGEKVDLWRQNGENALGLIDQAMLRLMGRLGFDIPEKATHFSQVWDEEVQKAQDKFNAFWSENVEPVANSLQEWLGEKIPQATTTFQTTWTEKVDKAGADLQRVYNDWIAPIFETLNNVLSIKIPADLDEFNRMWEERWNHASDILEPILGEDEGIASFINDVIDAVDDLKDKIKRFIEWLLTLQVPNPFADVANAIGGGGEAGKDGGTVDKSATKNAAYVTDPVGTKKQGDTYIYQVDARGSSLTAIDVEKAIERANQKIGRRADQIIRMKT